MAQEKKQVPLRLSSQLYAQLASWAQDDFRSLNGQIEFLLTEAVKKSGRGKGLNKPSEEGETPETDS